MRIHNKVFELVRDLEKREKRTIDIQQIADETGLNRNTVSTLLNGEPKMVRYDTLIALIKFFRSYGMNVEVSDLLVLETEGELVPAEMALVG